MIAIIPERVIGMPRNTDRHRPESAENNLLPVFAHKTGKIRPVPINKEARKVLEFWALGRKNDSVFYNHETGNPFVDLDAGLALACRKAKIEGVTWHVMRHYADLLTMPGGRRTQRGFAYN